jgi:hypothetical protein
MKGVFHGQGIARPLGGRVGPIPLSVRPGAHCAGLPRPLARESRGSGFCRCGPSADAPRGGNPGRRHALLTLVGTAGEDDLVPQKVGAAPMR